MSGADDFRAFFDISDLDYIGHIKGSARDKAIQWLAKQVVDASTDLCQVMQPNVQGLAPVEDPLATTVALIGFPPLDQLKIPAAWLPRTLSARLVCCQGQMRSVQLSRMPPLTCSNSLAGNQGWSRALAGMFSSRIRARTGLGLVPSDQR